MKFYLLLLAGLSVWRITHLLNAEDGPWDLILRLRQLAGNGFWANLMDCFYCLSLWTSAPFAWFTGSDWRERALLWPALSAAAILLQRAIPDRPQPAMTTTESQPIETSELEEKDHVLR